MLSSARLVGVSELAERLCGGRRPAQNFVDLRRCGGFPAARRAHPLFDPGIHVILDQAYQGAIDKGDWNVLYGPGHISILPPNRVRRRSIQPPTRLYNSALNKPESRARGVAMTVAKTIGGER